MDKRQNDEQQTAIEVLDCGLLLVEAEAAQVEGGIGTANGGVWKTTDGGVAKQPMYQKVHLTHTSATD